MSESTNNDVSGEKNPQQGGAVVRTARKYLAHLKRNWASGKKGKAIVVAEMYFIMVLISGIASEDTPQNSSASVQNYNLASAKHANSYSTGTALKGFVPKEPAKRDPVIDTILARIVRIAEPSGKVSNFMASKAVGAKYGAIDENGRVIVEPVWDDLGSAHEGLRSFCITTGFLTRAYREHCGYLSENYDVVIEPRFCKAGDFEDDAEGYSAERPGTAVVLVRMENRKGEHFRASALIDKKGRYLIEPRYGVTSEFRFQNGLAEFKVDRSDLGYQRYRFGFIDKTGKVVVEPIFSKVEKVLVWGFKERTGPSWKGRSEAFCAYAEIGKYGDLKMWIDRRGNYVGMLGLGRRDSIRDAYPSELYELRQHKLVE